MKRHITTTLWLTCAAACAATLLGCASTRTAQKEPTVREDFLEYRQLAVLSMKQVDATLRALDEVEAQAKDKPRPAYTAFANAVQQLEVDSVRVRARTAAMRARGNAYFENWEKYLSTVPREDVRRLAEERRADLRKSYDEIQAASQQARETFRPFLTDLQKLRAVLEAQPDLAHIDAQKALFLAAKDKGRGVQQALDRILAEMNSIIAMLTPPPAAPKH
jgi:hypothetical protein